MEIFHFWCVARHVVSFYINASVIGSSRDELAKILKEFYVD